MENMTAALIAALVCTVGLLVVTGYSIMGSAPLLIVNHDTPLDGRFIRDFFNTFYWASMGTVSVTAVSYGLAGRLALASGAAALALLAIILRKKIIARMDSLRAQILFGGPDAIRRFRQTHLSALLINLAQLVVIVWSLTTLVAEVSVQFAPVFSCHPTPRR